MTELTQVIPYEGGVVKLVLPTTPCLQFIETLDQLFAGEVSVFSLIIDTSKVKTKNVRLIAGVIGWLKRNKPRIEKYLRCSVVVVPNDTVQGILNAVFKVYSPVAPIRMVDDVVKSETEIWTFIESVERTSKP